MVDVERYQRLLFRAAGIVLESWGLDEEKLTKASDVVDNIDKSISQKNPATVLFKIGNEAYSVADLNKLIKFIEKKRQNSAKNAVIDARVKTQIVKRLFNERLFMREAIQQGLDKEQEFIDGWEIYQTMALANYYKNDSIGDKVTVTAKEVRDEYEKNKERLYTRRSKKGKKTAKEVMPFSQVSKRIESMLENRKKATQRKQWESELLKKAEYTINKDKLEGE
jgi:hypothetical protein